MKNEQNIQAWMEQGMPDDAEALEKFGITAKDIKKLEKRVMKAVQAKLLADADKMVFAEHRTLQ
jgi:hypothetical protein